MNEDKRTAGVDEIEIEPISDEDLESVSGGCETNSCSTSSCSNGGVQPDVVAG